MAKALVSGKTFKSSDLFFPSFLEFKEPEGVEGRDMGAFGLELVFEAAPPEVVEEV